MSLKQIVKRPILKSYLALSRKWPRYTRPSPNPEEIRKVLLMQFGGIGDSLRMIPLIRMLGEVYPEAELATLTNQSSGLFDLAPETFPACRHLSFDFGHGTHAKWRRLRALRRERFDLIVLPIVGDGFVEIAMLARLIGARYLAGFDLDGGGACFTHRIPFRRGEPLLTQYSRLLNAIGAKGLAENIPLKLDGKAIDSISARLHNAGLTTARCVVVQPWVGSNDQFKAWPPASFRELIARLTAELDVTVVMVGSRAEQTLASKYFGEFISPKFCNLTGALTFMETAALLARSCCLVSNDSCLIMVADALRVPSVAIFGATDPVQTLATASLCRPVRTDVRLPCQPCYVHQTLFRYECSHDFTCLKSLTVQKVLDVVCSVLAAPGGDMHGSQGS